MGVVFRARQLNVDRDVAIKVLRRSLAGVDVDITRHGGVVGTPLYLAPEQALSSDVDAKADIYSLGVMLFELVVGRPPFIGKTPKEVVDQHLYQTPPRIADLLPNPSLSTLDMLVQLMLAKDPKARPSSIEEVRSCLGMILNGASAESMFSQAPRATATSSDVHVAPRAPPRPRWPILLLGIGLGALSLGGYLALQTPAPQPALPPPAPHPPPPVMVETAPPKIEPPVEPKAAPLPKKKKTTKRDRFDGRPLPIELKPKR
jgi:eukaryotic-like serine/threonine-protein kinase